ncbi:MAG: carboxypeptidase regulatory-like domain-containing protein, partial [Acidobacteria bacterium]|nr:carboxypeptidase regulatory-like domain-containing protein [Acidobacteriota bacterium]
MWRGISRSIISCTLVVLLGSSLSAAQTNTGQINGTVRDSSGGVLPGVSVTVTNVNTALTRTEVTGPSGSYVVTNLPVGTYSVTAELQGFRRAVKTGFDLVADGRITADFTLSIGTLTETVQVTAITSEVVNRTSGEIARVIDGDQVRELALSGRNYLELASLIPGAVALADDQMAVTSGLGTGGQTINGARGNSNNLTVDGGFNLDSGSNASMINNVSLDFIKQVAIQTSNFSAIYGRNSGASINVVTKSGTNRFEGSVYEVFRDESLDAANYFAPRDPNGKPIKAKLDFNTYGGSFGGPLMPGKLFFFGGVEFRSLDRQESPQRRTLPTLAELRGDFSGRSVVIRDPLTGEPFPGNAIPPDRITADGRAIARVYEAMIARAAVFTNRPTGNNATYQLDFPFDHREDILRVDYRLNNHHSFYLRYLHDMYDLVEPRGTFIGANLPTISTRRVRPGYSYQLAHSWIARQNFINELKVNASWNGQRIPPHGDAWKRETYGFAFPQVYNGGRYDEGIPDVTISGFASLTGPSRSLLSPTTDITAQNTLTWIRGEHALRVGFLVTRNRKDQNGRFAHTGAVNFNPSGNPNTTGFSFADALLGNFRTYSEGADDPVGFFRFTQYAAYASDNWRVRPNLSLEIGMRYELAGPIYTQGNNVVNFDPALYDPRQAVTLNRNGSIASAGTNRYTGLVRAGTEIPEDQRGRVAVDAAAAALIPTGAPRGLFDTHHLFMPRFSGAYTLNDAWVLRGGVGLFYDKPEGNVIFSQLNLPPFVPSVSVENANLANPLAGRTSAATVLGGINAIDPNLQVPKQWNFSLSVQRELPRGHFAEIAYVGNRGRDLLWQPEINQPAFEVLAANAALPSNQRANTNFLRPFKGYSSIRQRRSDSFADYNSLQFYLTKRRGDISYTVSYTLSKATGLASGNGDNPLAAEGITPNQSFDRDFFIGPLSYDRRHVLVTTWTYRVPFLRDRRTLAGYLLGGWEISGKTRWQSGQYLTADGSTSTGTRRADYLGGEISLPGGERSEDRWFNTDVFARAADGQRGNAKVGMIQGPHWNQWDVSLRKYFPLQGRKKIGLRADVFN